MRSTDELTKRLAFRATKRDRQNIIEISRKLTHAGQYHAGITMAIRLGLEALANGNQEISPLITAMHGAAAQRTNSENAA